MELDLDLVPYHFAKHCPNRVFYRIMQKDENLGILVLEFMNEGKTILLAYIYIKAERRGSGIGTEVMNRVLNLGEKLNSDNILLYVACFNEKAQKLYKRLGFEYLDIISEFCYEMIYKFLRKEDNTVMPPKKSYIKLDREIYTEFTVFNPDKDIEELIGEYSGFISSISRKGNSSITFSMFNNSAHDAKLIDDVNTAISSVYTRIE